LYYSEKESGNEDSTENDIEVPAVIKLEVDKELRRMENGKLAGEDGYTSEMFKWGGEKMKE